VVQSALTSVAAIIAAYQAPQATAQTLSSDTKAADKDANDPRVMGAGAPCAP
jgi:hypothetical protein